MKPNLFAYATSELSQDAVLCWLLAWAKSECGTDSSGLHQVGREFLSLIYSKSSQIMPENVGAIEIHRQPGGIDILCTINGDTAIIIEDKRGSQQHSDQLVRYRDYVVKELGFKDERVLAVYIQTGDQCDYSRVTKHGYVVLNRADLLGILEPAATKRTGVEGDILADFTDHLRAVEDDVNSFRSRPLSEWTANSWRGFFTCVQSHLSVGEWDYVANPSGGFFGFWWHFQDVGNCEAYLQLEQDKLCFKVCVDGDQDRAAIRNEWHRRIMERGPVQGLFTCKPARFGNGQYMTVATLNRDYRVCSSAGFLDLQATLEILRTAQALLDRCVQDIRTKVSAEHPCTSE